MLGGLGTVKVLKDMLLVLWRYADTRVVDTTHYHGTLAVEPHIDAPARAVVPAGVADQIGPHLLQMFLLCEHGGQVALHLAGCYEALLGESGL